jgi:Concanavalin A-like lectin/glucanases superfamily
MKKFQHCCWLASLIALFCGESICHGADYVSLVIGTPNLLGYWRFDPVFLTNSVVNGYTGTLVGTAQIGPPSSGYPLPSDPTNQALILDGAGYLTTSLTGQITNQGSVIVWVYLTNQPSVAGHFFQITSQAENGNDFDFQIETDNKVYFYTDSGSSTVYAQYLPLNQWHFLAATFVANGNRAIYLDGSPVANSTAGSHSVNSNPFTVGNNAVFGGRYFQGRICEVAVFNRALTATEIATIYSAAVAPTLSIAPLSGAVLVTWPTNYPGFTLQTNASLGNSSGWGTVPGTYGILLTNYAVTNDLSLPELFFRLTE